MLVKCRALASVTAAVGNKIAVLQAGTLHDVITTRAFLVYLFRNRVVALYVCNRIGDAARESRGKSIRKSQTCDRDYSSSIENVTCHTLHPRYVHYSTAQTID